MKVIVAGFSKTGTKTMNAALRALGYNVYDFMEHFWYAGNEWKACMEKGEIEGLREAYESVDAVCDAPAYYFWDVLHELFPDAKIIFMMRDEDEWLRSTQNQLDVSNNNLIFRLLSICPTGFAMHRFMNQLGMVMSGSPPLWPWEKQTWRDNPALWTYRRHNAYVLHSAPKDKLLIYDVKEGWGPLCKFLGLEEPKKPFPHKNKRGDILQEIMKEHPVFQRIKTEMTIITIGFSALLLAGCYKAYPHAANFVQKFW